ncbi:MAG TPA: hypothetical protein VH251_05475 [Verrucomicrobiae bacterium]|jgi:hypothetical protein|nr:hypothetical protein [Verrucomicrobiae bacterium]
MLTVLTTYCALLPVTTAVPRGHRVSWLYVKELNSTGQQEKII